MRHTNIIDQARCDILVHEDRAVLMSLGMSEEEYASAMAKEPDVCSTCGDAICVSCSRHMRGACPTALIEAVMET